MFWISDEGVGALVDVKVPNQMLQLINTLEKVVMWEQILSGVVVVCICLLVYRVLAENKSQ